MPVPAFDNLSEEVRFWQSHLFHPGEPDDWQELIPPFAADLEGAAGDVEEVITSACHPSRVRDEITVDRHRPRKRIEGQTGRKEVFLTVIAAPTSVFTLQPIAWWLLDGAELARYLEWRRSLGR
jgi:hypothetical protein